MCTALAQVEPVLESGAVLGPVQRSHHNPTWQSRKPTDHSGLRFLRRMSAQVRQRERVEVLHRLVWLSASDGSCWRTGTYIHPGLKFGEKCGSGGATWKLMMLMSRRSVWSMFDVAWYKASSVATEWLRCIQNKQIKTNVPQTLQLSHNKRSTTSLWYFPLHLKCFTTLSCEISKLLF